MSEIESNRLPFDRKLLERIFSKIKVSTTHFYRGSPCWEWQAGISNAGYAKFKYKGKTCGGHRIIYEFFVEIIPAELDSDHLCRNRPCVNPAHIEPVPEIVNLLRGESLFAKNARKTHCIKGHPFSGDNLHIRKNGGRHCRKCEAIRSLAFQRRIRSLPDDHPRQLRLRENARNAYYRKLERQKHAQMP